MKFEARMKKLAVRVQTEMDAEPISDPIAAGAAVAAVYAGGECTPEDARSFIGLLATAASRVQEDAERDDLLCLISASCGSSLRLLGEKLGHGNDVALCFFDPAWAGAFYGDE